MAVIHIQDALAKAAAAIAPEFSEGGTGGIEIALNSIFDATPSTASGRPGPRLTDIANRFLSPRRLR